MRSSGRQALLVSWLFVGAVPGAGWASAVAAAPPSPPVPAGSVCPVPLGWRLAELDDGFDLERSEALEAAREAVQLWNGVAGREVFHYDAEEGFPIRFVHDERHGRIQERLRARTALEEEADRIRSFRTEVERARAELEVERQAHEERLEALERRMEEHQADVRYWNERGGAPPEEMRALERREEELNRERDRVNSRAEELNRRARRVNEQTDQLNRMVEEHNRARDRLDEGTDSEGVESGRYEESRRTLGPWILSVDREIVVFQFDDRRHLVRVLAHELGHALGLGHVGERDAIMYVYADARSGVGEEEGTLRLHPRDVELLSERCPEAFEGGRGR